MQGEARGLLWNEGPLRQRIQARVWSAGPLRGIMLETVSGGCRRMRLGIRPVGRIVIICTLGYEELTLAISSHAFFKTIFEEAHSFPSSALDAAGMLMGNSRVCPQRVCGVWWQCTWVRGKGHGHMMAAQKQMTPSFRVPLLLERPDQRPLADPLTHGCLTSMCLEWVSPGFSFVCRMLQIWEYTRLSSPGLTVREKMTARSSQEPTF